MIFVSTYPPRRCGLATFCEDLVSAVEETKLFAPAGVVALSQTPGEYIYGPQVIREVFQDRRADYTIASRFINESGADLVCLQHEFGIFGGNDGDYVVDMVQGLDAPLITTFHTVLSKPDKIKRDLMRYLADRSEAVVVMARRAVDLLRDVYGIDPSKIAFIHHGAPLPPRIDRGEVKRRLGLQGRSVICTLGLINPGKGIEYMIQAMPRVVENFPEAIYLVLGQTHPGVLRHMGEIYRDSLLKLVDELGLHRHVRFVDSYLTRQELIDYLLATDIYVTPYLGREQITSGTLAYAIALGKAIVSTRYVYAEELLGDGNGALVGFRDAAGIAEAVTGLLASPERRGAMELRAARAGLAMGWPRVARHYARLFLETASRRRRMQAVAVPTGGF